jgi:predicted ATP-grasp superfamily ATP-dependent carboligase
VGIDVIVDTQGAVQVLEVNPRLTTSFVGMRDAVGVNPARLVLELFYNEDFICPPLATNTVEVLVHA